MYVYCIKVYISSLYIIYRYMIFNKIVELENDIDKWINIYVYIVIYMYL